MGIEEEFPWISEILKILESGFPVIMPCDTIYGIVGTVPDSEKLIRGLKGRDESKPFLQLLKKEWVPDLTRTDIPEKLFDLWPGPLTLIVEGIDLASIAIRVPNDNRLLYLLEKLKKPLFSTSVNKSGKPILYRSEDIDFEFKNKVKLFVNEGDLPGGIPSTILDIRQKPFMILREGTCSIDSDLLAK
ncbi:MAG: Sua5/YciO/YrdC/YwlC family protein [Spirochaetales bacterium]|nr:Sua5/YciO/YrdC/YwlC family protein [Spirochaetales bacterium]